MRKYVNIYMHNYVHCFFDPLIDLYSYANYLIVTIYINT